MANPPTELSNVLNGRLFESIELIDLDELSDEERAVVPDWWIEAVQRPARDGIEQALAAWETVLPDALPRFYALIRQHGIGIFLGRSPSERAPLLAYAAALPSGETFCWYGFPPIAELHHPTLNVAGMPAKPHLLYTQLHDGFKLASAFHNGFPSSAEWFAVGEDLDTDSIPVEGTRAAPDLNQLMPLFFDFGASSVCVELGDGGSDDRDGWVVSDGQVQLVEDIWVTIDRWALSLVGS
jgi:hypothetical protein